MWTCAPLFRKPPATHGKAFCEHPFALHRQQLEKDKQNVDVSTPVEKILRTPMVETLDYQQMCRASVFQMRTSRLIRRDTKNIHFIVCAPTS